ncbi:MAG: hypothetical protein ACTTHX_04080 [Moraxella sp.]
MKKANDDKKIAVNIIEHATTIPFLLPISIKLMISFSVLRWIFAAKITPMICKKNIKKTQKALIKKAERRLK